MVKKSDSWSSVLAQLQMSFPSSIFNTFLVNTRLVSQQDSHFIVGCKSTFHRSYLEKNLHEEVKRVVDTVFQVDCVLVFEILPEEEKKIPAKSVEDDLFSVAEAPKINFTDYLVRAHLRPDFSFETYAVSTSNELAYAAAQAVSRSPGVAYNPLFLYGGVGVGKTHLMQAIGYELLRSQAGTKIIYCMGEEFTNEIITAIHQKDTKRFKDRYRNVDLLLVDDIQFIAGKTTVQEEFFHTFNALHRLGKQIVLTSDRSPHEIAKLEERILSRFEAGMIIDIQQPNFELRTAILLIKARAKNINLSMEIAKLISDRIDSPRKLEGFLSRIIAESQLKKVPITPEFIQSLLGAQHEIPIQKNIASYKDVIMAAIEHYQISLSDLKGERRTKNLAQARQLIMYLLRTELNLAYEEIGGLLGGRDHSTIIHGVDKIKDQLESSPQLQEGLLSIKRRVWG